MPGARFLLAQNPDDLLFRELHVCPVDRRLDWLFHSGKDSRRLCQQYATEIVCFLLMILAQQSGRPSGI